MARTRNSAKAAASAKIRHHLGAARQNLNEACLYLDDSTPTTSRRASSEFVAYDTGDNIEGMSAESVEAPRGGGSRPKKFVGEVGEKIGKMLRSTGNSNRGNAVILPEETPLDDTTMPIEPSFQQLYDSLAVDLTAAQKNRLKDEITKLKTQYESGFNHLFEDLRAGAAAVVLTTRSGRSFRIAGPAYNQARQQ